MVSLLGRARHSWCLAVLALAMMNAGSAAWSQPADAKADASQPEVPPDWIARIDRLSAEELLQRVARVRNALGRDGQETLRVRARVESIRAKAKTVIAEKGDDAGVRHVRRLLQQESTRTALMEVARIQNSKDQLTAFQRFLKDQKVLDVDLYAYRDLKDAEQALATADEQLEKIERILASTQGVRQRLPLLARGESLSKQLDELARSIDGKADATAAEVTSAAGNSEDAVRALLEALLR